MLTEKQVKGAWMLANGRTDAEAIKAAGIVERTFYKWKQKPEFMALVALLSEKQKQRLIEHAQEVVDLESARDDEQAALGIQREIVNELGHFVLEYIKSLREAGVEELPARGFPSFAKALADAVTALQGTNDRLLGLESLISDVEQIEKEIQKAVN